MASPSQTDSATRRHPASRPACGRLVRHPAVALGVLSAVLLVGAGSGCHRRAPVTQAKAPAGGEKSAGTKPTASGTGRTRTGAPAANGPGSAPASQKLPANAASRGVAAEESPFPGQGGQAAPVQMAQGAPAGHLPAKPGAAELVPGVPPMRIPAANRCPFRIPVPAGEHAPSMPTARGSALNHHDLGKPPKEMVTVAPLPAAPPGEPPFPWAEPRAKKALVHPAPTGPSPARTVAAAAPPAAPLLHLTGIIAGPMPMAVLEGDNSHYIVREGDLVVGGFRVASISAQKVVLLSGDRRPVVLRFGGKNG